jgi:hypothetical protein
LLLPRVILKLARASALLRNVPALSRNVAELLRKAAALLRNLAALLRKAAALLRNAATLLRDVAELPRNVAGLLRNVAELSRNVAGLCERAGGLRLNAGEETLGVAAYPNPEALRWDNRAPVWGAPRSLVGNEDLLDVRVPDNAGTAADVVVCVVPHASRAHLLDLFLG